VLVSAANASAAFDLRCEVREKLIAFLRAEYPDALPRARTELTLRELQAQTSRIGPAVPPPAAPRAAGVRG
jgi:hypothetical protein